MTLYTPWNTLVFYYKDFGYNEDLVPMGHVESGMELLAAMGDKFTVTMELMDEGSAKRPAVRSTAVRMTANGTAVTAARYRGR